MKNETKQRILDFVKDRGEASAKDIINHSGVTRAAVFRHLRKMIEEDKLIKHGSAPKVFYSVPLKSIVSVRQESLPVETSRIVEENFFFISPRGHILEEASGFAEWCANRKLNFQKTASEYAATLEKYNKYKKNGFINGLEKMKSTFEKVHLDGVYYLDFYSIERFGKTKLGWLLLNAKQTQNKKMMNKIGTLVKSDVEKLLIEKKIDAVGFIPPTIKREIQLQKEMEHFLNLSLPKINLVKTQNEVAVPQKSLSKLEDRIINAGDTIFVSDDRVFGNVLLIDDAVGSGATLNETARKIKTGRFAKKVIGLALTGSFKGFEVVNEV